MSKKKDLSIVIELENNKYKGDYIDQDNVLIIDS